jgi:hypothetical protein
MFWIGLGISHSSIISIFWCVCTHPINPMGIHLLRCVHRNKHKWTHDIIHNTFVAIVKNVSFHTVHELLLHALMSTTFNSSRQWINIMFTKIGIHTLTNVVIVDVVIADLMWIDLLPWTCTIQKFIAFIQFKPKKELLQITIQSYL